MPNRFSRATRRALRAITIMQANQTTTRMRCRSPAQRWKGVPSSIEKPPTIMNKYQHDDAGRKHVARQALPLQDRRPCDARESSCPCLRQRTSGLRRLRVAGVSVGTPFTLIHGKRLTTMRPTQLASRRAMPAKPKRVDRIA